ncbi:MAG: tape measure protein [Eggerthellaceae bacterium]|nr:tape measure protein [Eggerthellaceae bacterium]
MGLAFNDAMLAGGKGTEATTRAQEAYTKALAKGKFGYVDWFTLIQTAPAQMNQLAESILGAGHSYQDLKEALDDGSVSMEQFNDALIANGEAFHAQAQAATKGIKTSMENFGNRIGKFWENVINAIDPKRIANLLDGISKHFSKWGTNFGNLIKPAADAFFAFTDAIGGRIESAMSVYNRALEISGDRVTALHAAMLKLFEGTPVEQYIGPAADALGHFAERISSIPAVLRELREETDGMASVGDHIAVVFGQVAQAFGFTFEQVAPLENAIGDFIDNCGSGIAVAGLFAAAFVNLRGPITAAAGALGKVIPFVKGLGAEALILVSRFSAVNGGLMGVGKYLLSLAGPVGIAVAVVAALAAGFVYLMATNEDFRNTVIGLAQQIGSSLMPILIVLGESIQRLATAVMPAISAAINAILPVIGQIITLILNIVAAIAPLITIIVSVLLPIITEIITVVVELAAAIIEAVMPVLEDILAAINDVMPAIQAIVTTVMYAILAVVQAVWPAIQVIIDTVMGVIQGIIAAVSAIIRGDWNAFWNAVKGIADSVWNGIQSLVNMAMSAISSVISSVLSAISGVWSSVWSSVSSFVSSTWENVKSTVSSGVDGMMSFISSIPDKIMSIFSGAGSWLIDAGRQIIDGLISGISGALGGLQDMLSSVTSLIPDWKGPEDVDRNLLVESGEFIMGGLINGIQSQMRNLRSALGNVTSSIESWDYGTGRADFAMAGAGGYSQGGGNVYYIGDVTVDVSSLEDLATIEDIVDVFKRAKRSNPTKVRR